MKKTYLSIEITYYNSTKTSIKPCIHYYRNDGVHPTISTFDKLTVEEANQLMWELVKLGGKNSFESNWFDNAICSRKVVFWGNL